jgi:hypothetical protein
MAECPIAPRTPERGQYQGAEGTKDRKYGHLRVADRLECHRKQAWYHDRGPNGTQRRWP